MMNTKTNFTSWINYLTTMLFAAVGAGCATVGPDYVRPELTVPTDWTEGEEGAFSENPNRELADWWQHFDDPVLDELIARVLEDGLDIRQAFARLEEARAFRGVAESGRFPDIDAIAAYQRSDDSDRTDLGDTGGDTDLFVAGLDAAWELDLWGRVRRSVEAANAELDAAVEDVRGVRLILAAETAASYVDLRAFQRRLVLARTHVDLQRQTLQLVRARYDAGVVGERDVAQAAMNVEVTRSLVPPLEAGWRAAKNRLAVLAGLPPGSLEELLNTAAPIPVPPSGVAVDLPADLLRNRPDIRRAERGLAAEHARIGVATADLYPRLTLNGTLGVAAEDAGDLFREGSGFFGIGPSIRWNLFDGGRSRRRVDVRIARAEQARIEWERTVLEALEETENAMSGFVRAQRRRESLLAAVSSARRAVELAQLEYREGASDFQVILDSERTLAQLEDELASIDALAARQFIALEKSLGG